MKKSFALYVFLLFSFFSAAQKSVKTSPQLSKIIDKVTIIDSLNWMAEDFKTYENQIEKLEIECANFDCGEIPIQLKLYRAVDEINQGKSDLLYQFVLPTIKANQVQNPIIKAFLHEQAGLYYILNGQLDSCYFYLNQAEKVFLKNDSKHKRFGTTSEYLGFYYSFQNIHDTSITYMQQAIQIYGNNQDTLATIKAKKYLSSFYNVKGETEKSIETLLETKRLVNKFPPADYFMNRIDAGLANAYSSLNNYQKVEDISKKAILRIENISTKVNTEIVDLWDFYLILGEVQLKTNQLSEGLKNIEKAKQICIENDLPKLQYIGTLVSETDAQIQLELFAEAEKNLNEILNNNDKIDGYNTKIADLILRLLMSDYKPKTNFINKFKPTLKRLMEQHEELENTDGLKVMKLQTVFDIYNRDTEAALLHFQEVMTMNDSIESKTRNTALNELLVQQENLEQAQRLAQQEIEIKNKTIQRNRLIAGIIILLLIAFGLYFFYYQKQQLANKLEKEVQKRTAELKITNQKLFKSNQELERFNHVTSHDLKEPLRNVLSFVSLIERKKLTQNEDLNSYFKHIKNNANQMYQLLENIIQYTEIKNQKFEVEPVKVYSVIKEVEFSEKELIEHKKAIINYARLPIIQANESLLFIIFNNLIQNSLKFNEAKPPIIDIEYSIDESHHWFTIKDNGIGIESEYQESIFELFKRLHNRGEYKGSGVGLAMTKQIVEDLGGKIKLESEFGKGTIVRFSIPK